MNFDVVWMFRAPFENRFPINSSIAGIVAATGTARFIIPYRYSTYCTLHKDWELRNGILYKLTIKNITFELLLSLGVSIFYIKKIIFLLNPFFFVNENNSEILGGFSGHETQN